MKDPDLIMLGTPDAPDESRCIVTVRLTTTYWHNKHGMHSKRSLMYLKRQCRNHNFLDEDADAIGASESWPRIINIDECPDGVYHVIVCNEKRDWETGIVDDYDFKLVALPAPRLAHFEPATGSNTPVDNKTP